MRSHPSLELLPSTLRRAPVLVLALGVWLGCAFPAPEPRWLLLPAIWAFVATSKLAPAGQLALGTLLGGWLAARQPTPRCPTSDARGEWLGRILEIAPERSGRTSLVLEVEAQRGGPSDLRCRALVSAGGRPPEVLEGDSVWTPALALAPPIHLVNPLVGDSADALLARGIERVGSTPDGAGLLALAREPPWLRWRATLRAKAEILLRELPDSEGREIVRALGLGQRSGMTSALLDAFRDCGLRHLLTLGVFYLTVWMAIAAATVAAVWGRVEAGALRFPARRAAALCTLPMPLLYGVLGDGPSAQRATVLGLALAAAVALGRSRAGALHLLSLGLLGLLGWAPEQARNPALLWSVAAIAGICLLATPWLATPPRAGLRGRISDVVLRTLAIGAGAFVATAPLQVSIEHRIALLSVPLGVVGLAVALPCALLAQLGVLLSNRGLLSAALPAADSLARLAVATARFGHTVTATPAEALAVGGLGMFAIVALTRRRWRLGLAATALASTVWVLLGLVPQPATLRITFLSVGHGDATVIETPHGHVILIDAGGSVVGDFDPGRQIVLPFLESRGIRSIDVAILSHPHPDHANGLPAVFRGLKVSEFWHSGEPCPLESCGIVARLAKAMDTREVTLGTTPFTREIDGVRLELLSPQLPEGYDPDLGPNDNSLVFALRFKEFRALLTGDIEATAESRLTDRPLDLGAFLLKAPHHGSDTSSTAPFVKRVHPGLVVFSVGPHNRFDFPRASVVERYRALGTRTLRTDLDGAVTVETDGRQAWVTPTLPHSAPFRVVMDDRE